MIEHLRGVVDRVGDGYAVVEARGVGYGVNVAAVSLAMLKPGDEIKIYTYEYAREDGTTLYGFLTREERETFGMLMTVSGVGPKAALGVINSMRPDEITLAILTEDAAAFTNAPGVGKKTAQMIIFKLKDKVGPGDAGQLLAAQLTVAEHGDEKRDAVEALISLGYSKNDALKAVLESALPEMKAEQIIRLALRNLNR